MNDNGVSNILLIQSSDYGYKYNYYALGSGQDRSG